MSNKSTMQWFAGIMIAVMSVLVIWWFAEPGVSSDPAPMKVTIIPEVKIIDDSLTIALVNKKFSGFFTVYNSSDSVVDYSIRWDPGANGKAMETARFSIDPHSTRLDTLANSGFKNPGTYRTTLIVYAYLNNEPKLSTKYECKVKVTNAVRSERKRK